MPPVLLLDRDGGPLGGGGLRRDDARQLRLVQLTNAVDLADGLLSREVRCQVLQQVANLSAVHALVGSIFAPHDVHDELVGLVVDRRCTARSLAEHAPLALVWTDVGQYTGALLAVLLCQLLALYQ